MFSISVKTKITRHISHICSPLKKEQLILFIVGLFVSVFSYGQTASITGQVTDVNGKPIEGVNVVVVGYAKGIYTMSNGKFALSVPAEKEIEITFSFVGSKTFRKKITLSIGSLTSINPVLEERFEDLKEFTLTQDAYRESTIKKIDPKVIGKIPSASGNFETVLFSQPGVVSNNELSSQYSVRGGNFDENLVYVNDIQIYRPFLVRSGQQEGLSFVNSDLVSDIKFSAGGFESTYGDKMSSVLDIKYKEPVGFSGSVSAGLLGGSIHIENASKNHRFTQIHGFRYRSNQYVLNSLDTKGEYKPSFLDYQTYVTYDLTDKLQIDFLGNITSNKYQFIPVDRQSEFGNINQALRLSVFFAGQEVDEYQTFTGALAANYWANKNTKLKFITSAYRALETETFDIQGAYRLDELERDLGSDDFGDVAFSRGTGGFINHARNYLDALVTTAEHKGWNYKEERTIQWGLKLQNENIIDQLSEWEYIDSNGYSSPQAPSAYWTYYNNDSLRPIPFSPKEELRLKTVTKANNNLSSNRAMGYFQYSNLVKNDSTQFSYNLGIRFNYWDFNNQLLASPRASVSWLPNWDKDMLFRFAWGYYHQPAFYREMRNLFGELNPNIKAQTSIHYVLGNDYNFKAWNRPFKLVTELYFKQLKNLIPYEIDNVRLRYYAKNIAEGYSTGIDLKINGEFVKGVESWVSIGVMNTREDILNDFYKEFYNSDGDTIIPGYTQNDIPVDSNTFYPSFVPRPTDQRVTFGLFFQDYLPRLPSVKMNLSILYGTGLPFGPPSYDRYKDTLRIPPYRRVDIGGSYMIIKEGREKKPGSPFNSINSMWIGVEVFNLLQVNNTISYLWIRDVTNRQYAIPNFLTNRQVNLRFVMQF